MKIFVKKDNNLKPLGEGKIYSKSQLRLNEDGFDANLGTANGIQQAQIKAKQMMNNNPTINSASADAGKLDGQSDTTSGEGVNLQLPVNATGAQLATANLLMMHRLHSQTQRHSLQ